MTDTPVQRTADEGYFKRGARIKPALRAQITAAAIAIEPVKPPADAYALAMANLHKPWARRYLKSVRRLPWV